jgi:hypothetical protein
MTMLVHRLALSFLLAAPLVAGHTQVIGATGISTGVSFARNENYLGSSRVNLLMYHPSIYSAERLRFTPAHITPPASKATVEVSTLKVPALPGPKSSSLLIQTLGFHTLTQAFLPLSSRWGQWIISVLLVVVLSPSPVVKQRPQAWAQGVPTLSALLLPLLLRDPALILISMHLLLLWLPSPLGRTPPRLWFWSAPLPSLELVTTAASSPILPTSRSLRIALH